MTFLSSANRDQGYNPERLSNRMTTPSSILSATYVPRPRTEYQGAGMGSISKGFEIVPITGRSDTIIPGPQLPYFSTKIPERHNRFHGR